MARWPRTDGNSRPQRNRLHVAGRASFPRRVLAFLGGRDVFGGGQPAHQADASGVGNHPDTAQLQPSGARGRARRGPGPGQRRTRGVRHRGVVDVCGTRRVPRLAHGKADDVEGMPASGFAHDGGGAVPRSCGQVLPDAAAQRDTQADPEAASAGVGGMFASGDDRDGGQAGAGRADLRLSVAG